MTAYETGINVILGGSVGPRIREGLEDYARRAGMPFQEYRKTHTGFMAALQELNRLCGMRVYDVVEEECFDQSAIAARRKGPGFVLDDQSHIHFRTGGYPEAQKEAQVFHEVLGGARRSYVPGGAGIVDMTKDTWIRELFFQSDTDVTFLNTLSFGEYFGGQDSFSTEECVEVAKEVNDQFPGRVMTLGTVEPGAPGYLEKLEYYVKELGINGLKLYPWDATSSKGWWCDDEEIAYPLWEKCLELGINKVQIHKGFPLTFMMAKYVHPSDLDQPIRDFPDMTFVVYHAGFPYIDEMVALRFGREQRDNVWVDIGTTFGLQVNAPVALAETMAKLIKHIGADRICWGTDTPVWGSPQWQIEALRKLMIPEELMARYNYPDITDEDKELIFGRNFARLYDIDVPSLKDQFKGDKMSQAKAAAR